MIVFFAVLSLLLFLAYVFLQAAQERQNAMRLIRNKGSMLTTILALQVRTGVLVQNADILKSATEGITGGRDISGVRILDAGHRVLYLFVKDAVTAEDLRTMPTGSGFSDPSEGKEGIYQLTGRRAMLFAAPVVTERLFYEGDPGPGIKRGASAESELIGYVQLAIDMQYHEARLRQQLLEDIALGLVLLLTGGSIFYWHIRKSTRSLTVLADAVRRFSPGSPFVKVAVRTHDEVGRLAESFNVMGESLLRKEEERQRMETQFRQAQKMEAVGTMAGGIAHDFKNILTAISGFSNLAKMSLEKDDPVREYVEHILTSSSRASTLVQSLLAFSRRQVISPKAVDLNGILTNLAKMLRRLIREDIHLNIDLSKEPSVVMADAGQIEQVLMNLCTNARDAMPQGGTLSIAIGKAESADDLFPNVEVTKPGVYATITVSDTGTGMDEETLKKIFEPFFTTKEVGRGSGLGLASVYGIVKQHDGYIDVKSVPGQGTIFCIYLPMLHADDQYEPARASVSLQRGSEVILVAEDDEEVRIYIHDILRLFGYTVIEAADGDEAVRIFTQHPEVDLLLLDVVMPGKNGKEVLDAIRALAPNIKALFLSGYSADIISRQGVLDEGINFLSKPVSPEELLIRIREILDSKPSEGPGKKA